MNSQMDKKPHKEQLTFIKANLKNINNDITEHQQFKNRSYFTQLPRVDIGRIKTDNYNDFDNLTRDKLNPSNAPKLNFLRQNREQINIREDNLRNFFNGLKTIPIGEIQKLEGLDIAAVRLASRDDKRLAKMEKKELSKITNSAMANGSFLLGFLTPDLEKTYLDNIQMKHGKIIRDELELKSQKIRNNLSNMPDDIIRGVDGLIQRHGLHNVVKQGLAPINAIPGPPGPPGQPGPRGPRGIQGKHGIKEGPRQHVPYPHGPQGQAQAQQAQEQQAQQGSFIGKMVKGAAKKLPGLLLRGAMGTVNLVGNVMSSSGPYDYEPSSTIVKKMEKKGSENHIGKDLQEMGHEIVAQYFSTETDKDEDIEEEEKNEDSDYEDVEYEMGDTEHDAKRSKYAIVKYVGKPVQEIMNVEDPQIGEIPILEGTEGVLPSAPQEPEKLGSEEIKEIVKYVDPEQLKLINFDTISPSIARKISKDRPVWARVYSKKDADEIDSYDRNFMSAIIGGENLEDAIKINSPRFHEIVVKAIKKVKNKMPQYNNATELDLDLVSMIPDDVKRRFTTTTRLHIVHPYVSLAHYYDKATKNNTTENMSKKLAKDILRIYNY